jgi:hypothetical protein
MAAENGADPSWRPFLPLAVGVLWGSRWFCFRRFAQTAEGSRWRSWSTVGTTHTKPDVRIVDTAASARSHLSSWLLKVPSTARPREPAGARAAGLFDRFGHPSKSLSPTLGKDREARLPPGLPYVAIYRQPDLFRERPPKARYRSRQREVGALRLRNVTIGAVESCRPCPAAPFPVAC